MSNRASFSLLAGFLVLLLCGSSIAQNFMGRNIGYDKAWGDLPLCEEDEYLYPVDDDGNPQYEGPGEARPNQYGCIHVDVIGAGSLVQCVPGEAWYPNSFADDVVEPTELVCIDPHNGGLP